MKKNFIKKTLFFLDRDVLQKSKIQKRAYHINLLANYNRIEILF